jgi:hypothetical protein
MSREFEMSMMGEVQFFLGHCAEVQDGGFQGYDDADEYDYGS